MSKAKDKYLKSIALHDHMVLSPLTMHLTQLRASKEGSETADLLEADLIEAFTTESGLRALMLLEKSVLCAGVPNGASESALREMNAVRNFVFDIRRIVAHGR